MLVEELLIETDYLHGVELKNIDDGSEYYLSLNDMVQEYLFKKGCHGVEVEVRCEDGKITIKRI